MTKIETLEINIRDALAQGNSTLPQSTNVRLQLSRGAAKAVVVSADQQSRESLIRRLNGMGEVHTTVVRELIAG